MSRCTRIEGLEAQIRRGQVTADLQNHIDTCPDCARAALRVLTTRRPEVPLEDEAPLVAIGWASEETEREVEDATSRDPALRFLAGRPKSPRAPGTAPLLIGAVIAAAAAVAIGVWTPSRVPTDDDPSTQLIAKGETETDIRLTIGDQGAMCVPWAEQAGERRCPWRPARDSLNWWYKGPIHPREAHGALLTLSDDRPRWFYGPGSRPLPEPDEQCEAGWCIISGGVYGPIFDSGPLEIIAILSEKPLDRDVVLELARSGASGRDVGHVRVLRYRVEALQ